MISQHKFEYDNCLLVYILNYSYTTHKFTYIDLFSYLPSICVIHLPSNFAENLTEPPIAEAYPSNALLVVNRDYSNRISLVLGNFPVASRIFAYYPYSGLVFLNTPNLLDKKTIETHSVQYLKKYDQQQ